MIRDSWKKKAGQLARFRMIHWLGCRDSNPNYLIQSQASYR